jgi:hypothetical protein
MNPHLVQSNNIGRGGWVLLELAGSRMLRGKNLMSRITFLPVKIRRENLVRYNFYCTLPENLSSFQVTQMRLETHVSGNACIWKRMRLEMHASPDASMNPIFPNIVFCRYKRTRTPTVPSGHWLASLLVQPASTIRDSRLCRLCSNVVTCNHVPFWMALT